MEVGACFKIGIFLKINVNTSDNHSFLLENHGFLAVFSTEKMELMVLNLVEVAGLESSNNFMFSWFMWSWVLQMSLEMASPMDLVISLLEVTNVPVTIAEADAIRLPIEFIWFSQCLIVDMCEPPGAFKMIVMEHNV